MRSLVKSKGLVCGGGAPEIEIACRLTEKSRKIEVYIIFIKINY